MQEIHELENSLKLVNKKYVIILTFTHKLYSCSNILLVKHVFTSIIIFLKTWEHILECVGLGQNGS